MLPPLQLSRVSGLAPNCPTCPTYLIFPALVHIMVSRSIALVQSCSFLSRYSSKLGLAYPAQANLSLYTVTALLILDTDGQRVLAKYYAPPHQETPGTGLVADLNVGAGGPGMLGLGGLKEQKTFEKGVMEKIRRGGGEFLLSGSGI